MGGLQAQNYCLFLNFQILLKVLFQAEDNGLLFAGSYFLPFTKRGFSF